MIGAGSSGSRARGGATRHSGVKLEGQAALSVQGQLGRRSQLSRVSPNSKRLVYNASNTCSDFICCALKGFFL